MPPFNLEEVFAKAFRDAIILAVQKIIPDLFDANTRAHATTSALLQQLQKDISLMATDLTRLTADVAAAQGFRASVLVIFQGFKDQIKVLQDAATSGEDIQPAIDKLATDLEAATAPLVDAAVANPLPTDPAPTPTEPVPEPDPAPVA